MSDLLRVPAHVVTVDAKGRVNGIASKLEAHQRPGLWHRAFSVFIVNRRGETLLQRRSGMKYHFRGLWSNSCCSHQTLGRGVEESAQSRLSEELGLVSSLRVVGEFRYQAIDAVSGLVEREWDTVLLGRVEDSVPLTIDEREVSEVKWVHLGVLPATIAAAPDAYTPWLSEALNTLVRTISIDAAGRVSRAGRILGNDENPSFS